MKSKVDIKTYTPRQYGAGFGMVYPEAAIIDWYFMKRKRWMEGKVTKKKKNKAG